MKTCPYVFFLDIDGTILYNGTVSEKTKIIIAKARSLGNKVVICSGRSRANAKAVLGPIEIDGWITNIGTCVEIDNNVIFRAAFTKCELKSIFHIFENEKTGIIFDGEEHRIYNVFCNNKNEKYIVNNTSELLKCFKKEKVAKCLYSGVLNAKLADKISKNYELFQHKTYAEFCKKGFSKQFGMEKVMQYYNIPIENSFAIGDSINDLDMLRIAGISIAMGNAPEIVKSECDYVTLNVCEDGVSYAMEQFLKNKDFLKD